jgi:rod shape-determining protein MreC
LRRLRADYQELLSTLEEYSRLANALEDLRIENELLREQLKLPQRIGYDWLAARVIAKEPGSLDDGITINRGRRQGVEEDMPVIAYVDGSEGLVGRVFRSAGGYSVVQPVYAPNSYIAARLQRTRHEGLVAGTGRSVEPLRMDYVPPSARNEVAYGDVVVTSGNNSIFPPGLRVGVVRRVEAPPYEPSLQLALTPVIDFTRIEYVFVLQIRPELPVEAERE